MILSLLILLIAIGLLYGGLKFYRHMDWQEKQEPSPDLRQMHKKQAQLQNFQDLLSDAYTEGKISKQFLVEFSRYCDHEIQAMQDIEHAWLKRKKE